MLCLKRFPRSSPEAGALWYQYMMITDDDLLPAVLIQASGPAVEGRCRALLVFEVLRLNRNLYDPFRSPAT